MMIALHLSTLALRQVVGGACRAAGFDAGEGAVEGVVSFLASRFTDHSDQLLRALDEANDRAWRALEIALAGDSFWERCKVFLAPGEEKGFRERVRAFLDVTPQAELFGKREYCQRCLRDLQAARKAGLLKGGRLEPERLARQAGTFARYADPQRLIEAEGAALDGIADELRRAGHEDLAGLVALRPQQGPTLLIVAVRYFFRRAVEDDPRLFQALAFAQLEGLQQAQERGFADLNRLFAEQGDRLEQLLGDVRIAVAETHGAVLDIQEEQRRQGEQARDIYSAVIGLQGRLDLLHHELRPRDSLSIRGDGERLLVREVVARYRALPEEQRRRLPALLNAVGKLEVAAGDFQAAQHDFVSVAQLVSDRPARAEAHANACRAALERRDWDTALAELRQAVTLEPARFAPFPQDKYEPVRILGAGGFGVAFLCRHRYLNADVVIKTLTGEDLDRDVEKVFVEGQVLRQLDHPAIIRLQDCGYADPAGCCRPYLVMDYFDGVTLEEQARREPLRPEDLLPVARLMAEGLHAAHARNILHRDVKPANVLVRKGEAGWEVKLIDFGLALRRGTLQSATVSSKTLQGSSITGTLDYAAPEQMGKRPGAVGPHSDVYGFAKTCCYALFQTPQPLLRHWRSLPAGLAELLESCLEETPEGRPAGFAAVLDNLGALVPAPRPAAPPPPVPPPVSMPARVTGALPYLAETILQQCAAARPHPWYPLAFLQAAGVSPPEAKPVIDQLLQRGLIEATERVAGQPGLRLTADGERALIGRGSLTVVPPAGAERPVEQLTAEERKQELAALARRVAACERCAPLARSRTQTVFGVGPLDAEVMFIGEAPGADEDREGEPFVGAAGQLFNRILATCGLKREEVYITNMLRCRPPGNRTPTPGEVSNCREFLDRQIALVRPRVICALGGCAAQNLLGTTQSLGKLRGHFHDYRGTPVLCTYHPAFLLPHRSPEKKRDVWQDMVLLLRRLGRPVPSLDRRPREP
jgi:uracil-DNA glycosylase family 4